MNAPAILCVDDEPLILLALKQELKSHFRDQYLYETAASAEEALEVIDELEDDGIELILVLTDWLMPGMRGDEFLNRVRQEHPTVRTVMITGHANPEALERVERERLTDVILIKPWKTDVLIQSIEKLVLTKRTEP
jgi:CheY-like chemotaxis protein